MPVYGPRLRLDIAGDRATAAELKEIARRAYDARPVMQVIMKLMLKDSREQFYSEGGRTGESWKQDTAAWRQRKLEEGLDTGTERMTLALFQTLTLPEAASVVEKRGYRTVRGKGIRWVSRTKATFGTSLFYAAFQGRQRRLLGITVQDSDRWVELMVDWILSANLGE